MNKTEIKAMETAIKHAKIDIDYGAGGSYTSDEYVGEEVNEKEYKEGKYGIQLLEQIIETIKQN